MKIVIFLLLFVLLAAKICRAKKEVNILRLASCPEYKNYTIIFQNVVFTKNRRGKTVAMKFEAIFKKEVKRLMLMVTLRKCDNSENLDSCEYYMNDFKVNNVCDIMKNRNQIWSRILSNSNFPKSCPIPAGKYNLNDTKLDDDMQLTLLPVPVALWKIRFFTYDSENNNVMVCCNDLDVKVYNVRRN